LAFLKDAARLCGFEFFLTRNTLFFINPRKERSNGILTLKWHENLQEFLPRINTAGLVPLVEVWGHLPNSKKPIVKTADADNVDLVEHGTKGITSGSKIAERLNHEKVKIINRNFSTEQEASDMAKAHLNITSDKVITASCSIVGNPDLTPGQYVKIEGIGRNLSGKYFVTDVTNTIDGNGYSTKFNVSRNNIVL
jgi:phage protein D